MEPPNDMCHSMLICSGLDDIEQKNLALNFIVDEGLSNAFIQYVEGKIEG